MSPSTKYLLTFAFLLSFPGFLYAQETEKVYLSGKGNDQTVTWDFFCTAGRNSGKWTTIAVPSNWELQGFGKYDYGFAKDTTRGKEKGLYRYFFNVPAARKGKRINLVFEGVMTDAEVKINGKLAGPVHQGSYYAFKYDVSGLLTYGAANQLEVAVSKHSANESVNDAERRGDFWLFGGIFRPVYLEVLPAANISHLALDAKANGDFKAMLTVAKTAIAGTVSAQVYDSNGKKIGVPFSSKISARDSIVYLQSKTISPRLWSPEYPHLYKVKVDLVLNGKITHTVSQKFGFRSIVVKEKDGVYVNGVKVKFKGVNRHSFWPSSGRTLSKKLSIMDVNLMKDMNMNAVRMSHYPPDDHFLDVCDSLGIFVFDELAGWHGKYNTPTGTKLVKELLRHDVNHPSIIFWINGNEGGHNYALDADFDTGDIQRRPVIHAWENFRGFDTQHYREFDYGIGNYMQGHDLVMPTEFLHGMFDGGHGAGLEDYWEAMWRDPLAAGGFLWDFSDEGVVRSDKNNEIDTDGNHGADGIVGPYREKEGSFFTIRQIWSPVFFEKREITPAFDGSFRVENRFAFTNTMECTFSGKLVKAADPYDASAGNETEFSIVSPGIAPSGKGTVKLNLPSNWKSYDFLYVTVTDPHKRLIFTWSWPISRPSVIADQVVKQRGSGKVETSGVDSLFIVTANGVRVSFSKKTGQLRQVENAKGVIGLRNGPVLQEGATNFSGFIQKMDGNNVVIESVFDKKNSFNTLQWTIYPSGWIKMKVLYFPGAYFTSFVGVNFGYPEAQMKGVQWMGNGPYRVWKNRMKGNQLGVWTKAYNNSATGEPPFLYPEFKGYHSNMYWCRFNTTEQPFTVVAEQEDIFLRLYTPKVSDDPYNNLAPAFPSGDISFMQGISGIGTKTQKTDTTGPMGMKYSFYDYEKDQNRAKELVLYFDFSGR
ncbi:glycoside hydrolase family 2 protein [Hufsiella ginkgonis]|uniref:beta-galactosidase n=1 Tax=Hufsiella ginkgonis TaxID=2695274 RepID=A0A7K1XW48_9SPHI|nr:glycoside hydrolase family 2 TIM barrel-domain containing protein [Hufsiella ginkgonis]MXV15204.1 glycoside hydrolase family 2 [Hufsiella ginkgonis]